MLLLAAMLLQAGAPTVGDTVWITRVVAHPPGGTVRPAFWMPEGDVEALGPPRVTVRGDSVEIAYPAVAWIAGEHAVEVPGPLLLLAGGGVDSLPPARVTLSVASVLPRGAEPKQLKVQPPTDTVRRDDRTLRPLILLLLLGIVALLPLHWWWRRRGHAVMAAQPSRPPGLPLARWGDLGESRVVLAAAASSLRAILARGAPSSATCADPAGVVAAVKQERPDWPADEIRDVLGALEEARFTPGTFPGAGSLAEEAVALADRLGSTRP